MNKESKKEELEDVEPKKPIVEPETSSKAPKESPKKISKNKKVIVAKEIKEEVIKKTISFDAFFAIMRSRNSSIMNHHKAPMIAFLRQKDFKKLMATREEFEDALKNY